MSPVNSQFSYSTSTRTSTPSRNLLSASATGLSNHSIKAVAFGALAIGCAAAVIAVGIAWAVLPLTFLTGLIATISLVVGFILFGGLSIHSMVAASVCSVGVVIGGIGAAISNR